MDIDFWGCYEIMIEGGRTLSYNKIDIEGITHRPEILAWECMTKKYGLKSDFIEKIWSGSALFTFLPTIC